MDAPGLSRQQLAAVIGGDPNAIRQFELLFKSALLSLIGDVTGVGVGNVRTAIAPGAVTLGKMAPLEPATILGNDGPSAATPRALNGSDVTAMLTLFSSVAQGLVPSSGGGTETFLRADGDWAVPPTAGEAGGDLSGNYPNPAVAGIKGASIPPLAAGYLHYTGSAWEFAAGSGGGAVGFGGLDCGDSGALAAGSPGFNMGASA